MTGTSLTVGNFAKMGGAETCTNRTKTCTVSALQEAITDLIYLHNPRKTWAFVANAFGLKERAAKHRLSNTTSYTIEELQILFWGPNGHLYFKAIMAGAHPEPDWWKAEQQSLALSEARLLQAQAQQKILSLDNAPMEQPTRRKMKRFIDADRNLNAKRAEKELAVGVLHQNAARALDSGMAGAKARPRAYAGRER